MPNRKKAYKVSRRMPRRRQLRSNNNGTRIAPHLGMIVPDKIVVKQRVVHLEQVYTMSGSGFSYFIIANSLYNPGGGNFSAQPADFQNWMSFYNKYKVLSSRVQFKIVNITSGAINGMWFAVYPSLGLDAFTTYEAAACQKYSKVKMIGNAVGMSIGTLSDAKSTTTVYGAPTYDEDFSGTLSSDPVNTWFWHLTGNGVFDDPNYPSFQMVVEVQFITKYYARNYSIQTDP